MFKLIMLIAGLADADAVIIDNIPSMAQVFDLVIVWKPSKAQVVDEDDNDVSDLYDDYVRSIAESN